MRAVRPLFLFRLVRAQAADSPTLAGPQMRPVCRLPRGRRALPSRASSAPAPDDAPPPNLAPRPSGRLSRLLSQRADATAPPPPPRLGPGGEAMAARRAAAADAARAEVLALVALLPPPVAAALAARADLDTVLEVVMDVGRVPLARLPSGDVALSPSPVTHADIEAAVARLGDFGAGQSGGRRPHPAPRVCDAESGGQDCGVDCEGRARGSRFCCPRRRRRGEWSLPAAVGTARCG